MNYNRESCVTGAIPSPQTMHSAAVKKYNLVPFMRLFNYWKKEIQSAEITSHEVCHNTTETQSSIRRLTQGEFILFFFVPLCQIHFYLVRTVGDLPCVIRGFLSKWLWNDVLYIIFQSVNNTMLILQGVKGNRCSAGACFSELKPYNTYSILLD